jgi:metal-sulfur cluster biosynthetic enzyme
MSSTANLEIDQPQQEDPLTEKAELKARRDKVMEALRQVFDPELGREVVELGLIRNIELSSTRCHIEMILTTPFCPYAPMLLQQVRDTAEIAAGIPTTVELGAEMWDPSMMEDGAADDWGLW